MDAAEFVKVLGSECYIGVPDSQLKALCNYLIRQYGISENHIIAANEGNCVGLAAGYYLATEKIPVVYLQNSGLGNIVNPVASLLHSKVYGIPCIFVVGWRGEPGRKDEPQHLYQGEITLKLLEDIGISTAIISKNTTLEELEKQMLLFREMLRQKKCVAFLIKKDALEYAESVEYKNSYTLKREEAIEQIVEVAGEDIIISTTGKASRELYEIRENRNLSHQYDFLTVGSMGHSSSIALGIALHKPQTRVWCIDGDGAALMHMGAMAVIGANRPSNMIHIAINNEAHESVGGMPTAAGKIQLTGIASACGYPGVYSAESAEELKEVLQKVKSRRQLQFIEVKAAIGAREDLGRPLASAAENKELFMKYIGQL